MKLDVKAGVFLVLGFAFGYIACLLVSSSAPSRTANKPVFEMTASDVKPVTLASSMPSEAPGQKGVFRVNKKDGFTLNNIEIVLSEPSVEIRPPIRKP